MISKQDILKFNVPVTSFIPNGYKFQKLFARNHKSYRKKIHDYTIWCWVMDKTIEIEDWYESTGIIINFYKNNVKKWQEDNNKLPRPRSCMTIHFNSRTHEMMAKDFDEYYSVMGNDKKVDEYFKKYKDFREVVIHIESFNEVLQEIDWLTQTAKTIINK